MKFPKLERDECPRDFNIRSKDRVEGWEYGGHFNLTVKDEDGNAALRLLGLSTKQATELLEELAECLGKVPELTKERLRMVYNELRPFFEPPNEIDF